jgi:hypothetical protein
MDSRKYRHVEDRDVWQRPRSLPCQSRRRTQAACTSRRIVVKVLIQPATPQDPPTPVGRRELFLGFSSLCTACHFALGHIAGKTTDVVL